FLFVLLLALPFLNVEGAQHPVVEKIANKVIQKYQQSSCDQLWKEKNQPKPPQEQEAVNILRNDPKMREAFINKVAAPIANKMFECGMIPRFFPNVMEDRAFKSCPKLPAECTDPQHPGTDLLPMRQSMVQPCEARLKQEKNDHV